MTTMPKRLRLPLDAHDSDLLLVGDRFEEGGLYLQMEIHRSVSATWTWLDWDEAYDRLARKWHARFPSGVPTPSES
jgi:hypothetical protein